MNAHVRNWQRHFVGNDYDPGPLERFLTVASLSVVVLTLLFGAVKISFG